MFRLYWVNPIEILVMFSPEATKAILKASGIYGSMREIQEIVEDGEVMLLGRCYFVDNGTWTVEIADQNDTVWGDFSISDTKAEDIEDALKEAIQEECM